MRENFFISLSQVNLKIGEKGEHKEPELIIIALSHIVMIQPKDKYTIVSTMNGDYNVRESVEDISRRTSSYGIMKVV
jgi:vacuolar-type H+-ATPase catalytic subunit A/Vma1